MIGAEKRAAESEDDLPQLKFKIPNFIGSLAERKRPNFSNPIEDDAKNESGNSRIPHFPGSINTVDEKQPEEFEETRKGDAVLTETPPVHDLKSWEPVKPVEIVKQMRSSVSHDEGPVAMSQIPKTEQKQNSGKDPNLIQYHERPQMNGSDHQIKNYRDPNTVHDQGRPNMNGSDHQNSKSQISPMSYGQEADRALKEVVNLLGHLRSLGKHGFDQSIILESELRLEKENLNQLLSLVEMERRSKEILEAEISEIRSRYDDLNSKYLDAASQKSELELKIIEYESLLKSQERSRTILKEDNESMSVQLNQIRPELDKLQIDCVVLGNQKTDLENELCRKRAAIQEQEARLTKELKISMQQVQELSSNIEKIKADYGENILKIQSEARKSLEEMREKTLTTLREVLNSIDIPFEDSSPVEDLLVLSKVEVLKAVSGLKASSENAEMTLTQIKCMMETKQEAIESFTKQLAEARELIAKECLLKEELMKDMDNLKNKDYEVMKLKKEMELLKCNEKIRYEELQEEMKKIANLLGLTEGQNINVLLQAIEGIKVRSQKVEDFEKRSEALQIELEKEKESGSRLLEEQHQKWEQERQRLNAERYRLIQENENLRKRTPDSKTGQVNSSEMTAEIMRAIEADLDKSKSLIPSASSQKHQIMDESWTVSDNVKSPSKRPRIQKGSGRSSKRAGKNKSPSQSLAPSELDFWAFSRDS